VSRDVAAMNAYETIFWAVLQMSEQDCKSCEAFHAAMERKLRQVCKTVIREYEVPGRGDGRRGFIDLVVLEPFRAAIELDRTTPRTKSLFKVRSFSGEKFIVLRKDLKIVRVEPILTPF